MLRHGGDTKESRFIATVSELTSVYATIAHAGHIKSDQPCAADGAGTGLLSHCHCQYCHPII
jgi:hypothetical protein